MGFEVEIKFHTQESASLAKRLEALGATAGPEIAQEDAYLSHPARDFGQSGEALRVRREGEENRITYKGPKHSGPTKTREEIEIGFEPGEEKHSQMLRLWDRLGFKPVAILHKRRQPFHLVYQGRPIEVVLDVAEELGTFAEVETLAADAVDLPAAQAAVVALAAELGLTEVEPRSYLGMALARRAAAGSARQDDPSNEHPAGSGS